MTGEPTASTHRVGRNDSKTFRHRNAGKTEIGKAPFSGQDVEKSRWSKTLQKPFELNKTCSTNIFCTGANGSSAIVVLPAAQAKILAEESMGTSWSASDETIPSIQTVGSFDLEDPWESNKWTYGRMMEYINTGCC